MMRTSQLRFAGLAVSLVTILSCQGQGTNPLASATPQTRRVTSELDVPSDYVRTPYGYYHPSCIHEVAEGETTESFRHVRHKSGATRELPECEYPRVTVGSAINAEPPPPQTDGWVVDNEADNQTPATYMTSNFDVPTNPTVLEGQLDYFFPGLVDTADTIILQPVLQFGISPAGGGNRWGIASWSCGPSCLHSNLLNTAPGHLLYGSITGSNCTSAGACDWAIVTTDLDAGTTTTLNTTGDDKSYTSLYTGVLEAYGIKRCADYPANGKITFSNVAFSDVHGAPINPNWQEVITDSQYCSELHGTPTADSSVLTFGTATPHVAFTTPAANDIVAGTVSVHVAGTLPSGATAKTMVVRVDNQTVSTTASASATVMWDTTALDNGSGHTLTAVFTDSELLADTATLTVTVKNKPVIVVMPATGEVSGDVAVSATATAPSGTSLTQLNVNVGDAMHTGTSPFNDTLHTATVANGTVVNVQAIAIDADATQATATSALTVRNSPTVTLTVPDGDNFAGQLTLSATAVAPLGTSISTVDLQIDGQTVASSNGTSDVTFAWDTTALNNDESHTITAIATDADGTTSTTADVTRSVRNAPKVSIVSPAAGTVSGEVIVEVDATPPNGGSIATLVLLIDGSQVSSTNSTPLTYTWEASQATKGTHTLEAQATDGEGDTGSAQAVSVEVQHACGCGSGEGVLALLAVAALARRRTSRRS